MSETIDVPRIRTYGAGDLRRLQQFSVEGQIASEIDNFGNQYYRLHKGSIGLNEEAALFNAYLLSELGKIELPDEVRGLCDYLFNQKGRGNVTDDACDYDNGDKGMEKVKDTDRRVRWILRPDEFKHGDKWEAKLGEESDEKFILIPESGYVERTVDGAYRPDTGTPFSTVNTRKAAEQSWIDKGYSKDFAEKAVSYFFSREENRGTSAVGRWYYDGDGGRFGVRADGSPVVRVPSVGSLAMSRQPSGARSDPERSVVVVSQKDFEAAVRSSEQATQILRGLKQ